MTGYSVDEQCGCGARFTISGDYFPHLTSGLTAWRADHRHAMPERLPDVDFPPIPQGSASTVERAEQFDHDTRQPIGFAGSHA